MADYRPRVADDELARRMETIGAVLIEGPKACGKTATAARVAKTLMVDPQALGFHFEALVTRDLRV